MGFAESMNAALRANKALRKTLHRRDEHFNMKDTVIKRRKNIKYDFPKASKILLNSIRHTTKEDNHKENVKRVFALLIAVMIVLFIVTLIFVVLNK